MAVQLPTPSQLRDIAGEVGLDLTDADVTSFIELMRPSVSAYNVVDAMPDVLPAVRYLRTPGYRPVGEENSHNAWYVKTTVQGAPAGKLAGKTVALKDNIMLAGVPMMNGSATLEGYMPDIDATVVERILDAGARSLDKGQSCRAEPRRGRRGLPTSPPPGCNAPQVSNQPGTKYANYCFSGIWVLKWGVTCCIPPTRIRLGG